MAVSTHTIIHHLPDMGAGVGMFLKLKFKSRVQIKNFGFQIKTLRHVLYGVEWEIALCSHGKIKVKL